MPKPSENPPIVRVLLFGAPGVGKNCLESRFTTATYPPPYDPQLTISVRRHLTLRTPPECSLSSLPAAHALPDTKSPSPSSSSSSSSCALEKPVQPCLSEPLLAPSSSEYMVEIINHPGLQRPSERRRVLTHDSFDAVVIVYDVTSRESFVAAGALHREVRQAFPLENDKRLNWRMGSLRSPAPKPVISLVGNKSDLAFPAGQCVLDLAPEQARSPPVLDTSHGHGHAVIESWRRLESTGCNRPAHTSRVAASDDSRGTRQVATEEGLELASIIDLGTAFFETSAKTGANVDRVFETVVRAVRREQVAAADAVGLSRRMSIRRTASRRELDGDAKRGRAPRKLGDVQKQEETHREKAAAGGMLKRARSLFMRQKSAVPGTADTQQCKRA